MNAHSESVLFELITGSEELRLERYLDVAGVPTIGYGHTGENLPETCTEEQALDWFYDDVAFAERGVLRSVTVPLRELQLAALISFVFNFGIGAFAGTSTRKPSTLLKLLNTGQYGAAAYEFRKWRNAGGVMQPGLLIRRGREEQLFRMPLSELNPWVTRGEEVTA